MTTARLANCSDVLSAHVFDVLLCQTGSDALAVAQRADIALVLLDMILPDTNGLLVLQQLQRSRPDLPVVMLTGLGSESDVVVGWKWAPMIILPSRSTPGWWWRG
jgi:DNA-binding response OmpR family regulator